MTAVGDTSTSVTAAWSDPAYGDIARLVAMRTGLAFVPARLPGAEAGMRRAMARAQISDLRRYHSLVHADATALDDLLIELTVGETYFFRDPAHFDFIRNEVVPEVRGRRGASHVLRAWSAGCASGEEAYSLAILFAEAGLSDHVRLHATDISRTALGKARAASYERWSLRGEGAAAATTYLQPVAERFEVDPRIRLLVTIDYLNLALDTYPSLASGIWAMDLILCRNVLIYFDADTVAHVARRLFASLAEGGWLITGPSDPPLGNAAPFDTVVTDAGVFYRRPGATPMRLSVPVPAMPPAPRPPLPASATTPDEALDRRGRRMPPTPQTGPEAIRAALARGEYPRVVELTRDMEDDADAGALRVRALANLDPREAERACAAAVERHPLSPELQFLWGALLLDLGRDEDAANALRRVLYLDRSSAAAHFALAAIMRRQGDVEHARRGYRNARDLCAAFPADAVLPLTDGEPAARLAEAAEVELALLGAPRVG